MDGLTERVRQEEGQALALPLLALLLLHVKQCQQFNTAKRPRNFSNSLDNEKRDEVTLNQSPLWRQLSTACGRVDRVRQLRIVSVLSNGNGLAGILARCFGCVSTSAYGSIDFPARALFMQVKLLQITTLIN